MLRFKFFFDLKIFKPIIILYHLLHSFYKSEIHYVHCNIIYDQGKQKSDCFENVLTLEKCEPQQIKAGALENGREMH